MRVESLSSLQVYQDCPKAYEYKYKEKLEYPLKPAKFRMGLFVDRLLSKMLELKLEELSISQIQALWGDLREILWEDGDILTESAWIEAVSVAHRTRKFISSLGWKTFYLAGKPCVQVALQREHLRGIVDWIAEDKLGNLCIVDFKVVQTRQNPNTRLDYDKQLSFYAWLLRDKVQDRPIHMYQIRALGKSPVAPKKVLCSKSKKTYRPSNQKILTTWELWSRVAKSCGIDPDSESCEDTRIYLQSIVWDTLHRNFCPEEVQEVIADLNQGWQKTIYQEKNYYRNLRNYNLGPCNIQSIDRVKCPFVRPCFADLGGTPRPAWALPKEGHNE